MPKCVARLRTPGALRLSRTAIAAEFSPDAARARSRSSSLAQAKRKNTTAFAKTADAKLFKLHDTFVKAYETMKQYEGGAGAGSLSSGTKEERALYRKWRRATDDATQKARAVVAAPAMT